MPLIVIVIGILFLLTLILLNVKPLYALLLTSVLVGLGEGLGLLFTIGSIAMGVWDTLKSIAIILCLGAMLGKMIETGSAARSITNSLVNWFGVKNVHWAVMLTGLIVGIPLFYNAGFVILIPLVFSISYSTKTPLLLIGIPMAASLSVTHGFLPPHPGPTAIAAAFHADLGKTLMYGLVVALPAVVLAGPVFSSFLSKLNVLPAENPIESISTEVLPTPKISFAVALFPVMIIAISTLLELWSKNQLLTKILKIVGNPITALSVSLVLVLYIFGVKRNKSFSQLSKTLLQSIKDIALIVLIIAAGGGFKQVLIDSGVGLYIKELASNFNFSPLLLGWSVAALLRIALGSATVAGLTAAGIVLPFLSSPNVHPELMVLAVGSGSLMFSHVNDTGFWMFKEYFNLTLKQTFQSWTMMETIVSFTGLAGVLILDTII